MRNIATTKRPGKSSSHIEMATTSQRENKIREKNCTLEINLTETSIGFRVDTEKRESMRQRDKKSFEKFKTYLAARCRCRIAMSFGFQSNVIFREFEFFSRVSRIEDMIELILKLLKRINDKMTA